VQRSAKERRIEELKLQKRRASGEPPLPHVTTTASSSPISLAALDSLLLRDNMLEAATSRPEAADAAVSGGPSVSDGAGNSLREGNLFASLVRGASPAAVPEPAAPPASPTPAALALPPSTAVPSAPLSPLAPLGRLHYTPQAMVDLMALRPDYTHAMLCAHFGRPVSWLPTVLASDAFQKALDLRRDEISDPSLTASLHERYKALAIRTSNVMMAKLESPEATDFMVLKAGEIAFKALGMGQKHVEAPVPAAAVAAPVQESLAERLMKMMDERESRRTVNIDAEDITPNGNF
jgi:hypothetical protein